MNNHVRYPLLPLFIVSLLIWALPEKVFHLTWGIQQETEEQEIKAVLNDYFDARYRAFQTFELDDWEYFVASGNLGQDFPATEQRKLQLEIEHAKIFQLSYQQYEFFLEFQNIHIDQASQTAQINLIEAHDVIFEISAPMLSSLHNVAHQIEMKKIDGVWKIVSDQYDDYLWRWLKTTGQSADALLSELANLPKAVNQTTIAPTELSTSILYNRQGAITYAHRWATAPRPYNPDYFDFTDLGGDCTNFVSQAIFEGGKVEMVFGGIHDIGTAGWYYYDTNDRAIAWTWVDGLYNFIVNEANLWENHLVGQETGSQFATAGDILQFNWGTDSVWDHSVMIVSLENKGTEKQIHLVAGHSPDVDNYPYTAMIYSQEFRFIHIASPEIEAQETTTPTSTPSPEIFVTETPCYRKIISIPCLGKSNILKRMCRTRLNCQP